MKVNELVGDSKRPCKYMSVAPVCPVCGCEHVPIDGGPYDDTTSEIKDETEIEYDMLCPACGSTFAVYYKLRPDYRVDGVKKGPYA